jgi:hypothetical protein
MTTHEIIIQLFRIRAAHQHAAILAAQKRDTDEMAQQLIQAERIAGAILLLSRKP